MQKKVITNFFKKNNLISQLTKILIQAGKTGKAVKKYKVNDVEITFTARKNQK